MSVRVGDKVMISGVEGRVKATSGTDNSCIVLLPSGYTKWRSQESVVLVPEVVKPDVVVIGKE